MKRNSKRRQILRTKVHVDQQQVAFKNFKHLLLYSPSHLCRFVIFFFSLFSFVRTRTERRTSQTTQTRYRPRRSVEGPMNHKLILRDRSVGSSSQLFTITRYSSSRYSLIIITIVSACFS